jgi:hypothetical protein
MPPESMKSEEPAVELETVEESAVATEPSSASGPLLSNDMLKIMKGVVDYLTEYRDEK